MVYNEYKMVLWDMINQWLEKLSVFANGNMEMFSYAKQIVVLDKMSPLKKKKKLKRNDIIIFTKQEKFSIFFFVERLDHAEKFCLCWQL